MPDRLGRHATRFAARCSRRDSGPTGPEPGADPYCVEFDKRRQNVSELGVVEFLLQEPARVAAAVPKCFYFQSDHWRGSFVQEDGATKTYEFDGHYFFDKARGEGGAWVTNFNVNGRTQDPSQIPGVPSEFSRYFGPGTGGVITRNNIQGDPACVERAADASRPVYAATPPGAGDADASAAPVARCPSLSGAAVSRSGLGPLRLRDPEERVRAALGAPVRVHRGYLRYCVSGGGALLVGQRGGRSGDRGSDPSTPTVMLLTTARSAKVGRVGPGSSSRVVRRRSRGGCGGCGWGARPSSSPRGAPGSSSGCATGACATWACTTAPRSARPAGCAASCSAPGSRGQSCCCRRHSRRPPAGVSAGRGRRPDPARRTTSVSRAVTPAASSPSDRNAAKRASGSVPSVDGRLHRASGLLLVLAVTEAAPGGELRDVVERRAHVAAHADGPQAGRVDQQPAVRQLQQVAADGDVAAAAVVLPHGTGALTVLAEQGVGERRLAGAGRSEHGGCHADRDQLADRVEAEAGGGADGDDAGAAERLGHLGRGGVGVVEQVDLREQHDRRDACGRRQRGEAGEAIDRPVLGERVRHEDEVHVRDERLGAGRGRALQQPATGQDGEHPIAVEGHPVAGDGEGGLVGAAVADGAGDDRGARAGAVVDDEETSSVHGYDTGGLRRAELETLECARHARAPAECGLRRMEMRQVKAFRNGDGTCSVAGHSHFVTQRK